MKFFSRIVIVVLVVGLIYFARDYLYDLLEVLYDVISAFAANYTRK